jgi:hypothetical protein
MNAPERYVSLFPERQETVQETLHALDAEDGQPCIDCPLSAACADQQLACQPFHRWVHAKVASGKRVPTRAIYEGVFKHEDN